MTDTVAVRLLLLALLGLGIAGAPGPVLVNPLWNTPEPVRPAHIISTVTRAEVAR